MGVIKKQAFQSSVLLYTGTILGFITTGLIAPNLLSKSEIGTLRLLLSYSAIFMSVGILGFSTVTIRFIPQFYNSGSKKHNGFLGLSMIVGTIGFLITLLIITYIKPTIVTNNIDKSPQFASYFFLIIPLTFFQAFYSLFDSYNNALYRSSYGVFLRDFVQRILILIGLLLVFFHFFEFSEYIYYYTFSICLPTILILIYIIRNNFFDIRINKKLVNKALLGSMFSVGIFGLLNSMSNIAALQIDAIMINMYLDDAAVGVYVITFYFGTLVFIPSKALNKIAPTLIAKAHKDNDIDTIKDIYYRSSKNLFLIGCLILLGLLVNLDNIFHIIPKSYEEGKMVIALIGLTNLVKMAGGSNDSIIIYSKYYKVNSLLLIMLSLLIIISNFIFIPLYGIIGAAIATLISNIIFTLSKFLFIKGKFSLNPFNIQYMVILFISGIIYLFVSFIPDTKFFIIDIIIDSSVTTLLFYLSIKKLSIAIDMNHSINQVIEGLTKFFKTKF